MRRLFTGLLILISYNILAQEDTTMVKKIDTISISASPLGKYKNSFGRKSSGDTFEALEKAGVQLQNNGPGSLSTPFIHGLGARHTAIIWNGFNLQSPVNAAFDISLMPHVEGAIILPVSSSALLGNGALSGGIVLGDIWRKNKQITFAVNTMQNLSILSLNKWKSEPTEVYLLSRIQKHQNRYRFNKNQEVLLRENADLFSIDLDVGTKIKLGQNSILHAALWLQHYDRSIAPSTTSIYNQATQKDENYRLYIKLQYHQLNLSSALLKEGITFQDASVFSEADVYSYVQQARITIKDVVMAVHNRYDQAITNFYNTNLDRNTLSIQVGRELQLYHGLTMVGNGRKEWYDKVASPWLYSAFVKWNVYNNLWTKLGADRSYNLPSFNDLFWPTGGNPSLKPETANSIFGNVYWEQDDLSVRLDLYRKGVDNWILWRPDALFWSPFNQRSVLSYGFDFHIVRKWNFNNEKFILRPRIHYTHATVTEDDFSEAVIGNRLLYVPLWRWGMEIQYNKGNIDIGINYTGRSTSYTSTDNLEFLQGFSIFGLFFKYGFGNRWEIELNVENLFDKSYEKVAFFPQPLRNAQLQLKYLWK